MRHRILILALFLCFTLPLSTHISATPNEAASALQEELFEVRQREADDLQTLAERIAAAGDRLAVLELQREMANRKFETEIEVLEIRGRHARDEGRIERAEELERALTKLRAVLAERRPEGGGRP
jgi:hypothetical protein